MIPLVAFAFITSAPATASASLPATAEVSVKRSGRRWFAEYRLAVRQPVWLFVKSALPRNSGISWRQSSVRVLTPGVRLVRLGNHDALVGLSGPVPARVRLEFTPSQAILEAGYDPTLIFSDGSVALYGDQFRLVPARSAAEVSALGRGEDGSGRDEPKMRMTFRDSSGPVLAHGKRLASARLDDGATYVLFGRAKPVVRPVMTFVIDPATPAWLSTYLTTEMPRVLSRYREELGPLPVGRPTLLVTWDGRSPVRRGQVSLSGSVLPGLVLMAFKGPRLKQRSERAAQDARWFVSHEAAHFWLGQAVSYATPAESWITEGGAELLAIRATAAADPTFNATGRLVEARAECAPLLNNGGVASAYLRSGDFRAYYSCGLLIALAAERANGGDFSGFVRALIAGPGKDGEVSREEWMQVLEQQAGSRRSGDAVANLLDGPHPDPAMTLDHFVAATGIGSQLISEQTKN